MQDWRTLLAGFFSRGTRSLVLASSLALSVAASAAVTFTTLYDFPGGPSRPPTGVVLGLDGNFYGVTNGGGTGAGTVYRMSPDGALTTLYRFSGGLDGSQPGAALLLGSDGNFYGTTLSGGTNGVQFSGTIFRITPAGELTTLYNFDGTKGHNPGTPLIEGSDGNFYGTVQNGLATDSGGMAPRGAVFRMTPAGEVTLLYSFVGQAEGSNPGTGLVQASDGNFYGTTTLGGGAGNAGTIFKLTPEGILTTLHRFPSGAGGRSTAPSGALVEGADGNLYGMTSEGGAGGFGTIFKISTAGAFTLLHTFDFAAGSRPAAALLEAADGNFYGTTSLGGASNNGTVFRVTPDGTHTVLREFDGADDGSQPRGALVVATDGSFYGTTNLGAVVSPRPGGGTVFKITAAGAFTTVHRFHAAPLGRGPDKGVVRASDGTLFGTTSGGGTSGNGTFFRLTPNGEFTNLHNFPGDIGFSPRGVVRGNDGFFYGTLESGGAANRGAIYKASPEGAVTLLHSFPGGAEGGSPSAPLILGRDGNFYGTTNSGAGRIFKITPAGELTTIHTFTVQNAMDGYGLPGSLVEGTDGNFYGTTELGGTEDNGTVFKLSPAGDLTVLYRFSGGDDGTQPRAGLVQGSDGNFYGTTRTSRTNFRGTVFRITPAGDFTTLHTFAGGADGSTSEAPLIQASDGNFYGSTTVGGDTVFSITPSGDFAIVHRLVQATEGAGLSAPLLQAPDGSFYGTASSGGPSNNGTVFRLVVEGVPPLPAAARLLNISTRLGVRTGENVLIGGFIITGSEGKKVIIRAIGPSLASQGVAGALEDPTLDLFDGAGAPLFANDNWKESQQSEIEETTIPPANDNESAIVQTLAPGPYTAVVAGKANSTGIGLVEVYDLSQPATSILANISSRGFVDTGENVLIGGFIVGGGSSARVVVRALGPSLGGGGVQGALQDPTLQLVDANGSEIRANDNWQDGQRAELEALSIQPGNDLESALIAIVSGGNYTAVVRGSPGNTGVGLVEIYNVQ